MPENDAVATDETRTDRCPQCMPEGVESPLVAHIGEDQTALSCLYVCGSCGHSWSTNWRLPDQA